MNCTDRGQR